MHTVHTIPMHVVCSSLLSRCTLRRRLCCTLLCLAHHSRPLTQPPSLAQAMASKQDKVNVFRDQTTALLTPAETKLIKDALGAFLTDKVPALLCRVSIKSSHAPVCSLSITLSLLSGPSSTLSLRASSTQPLVD